MESESIESEDAPHLKYSRINASINDILRNDTLSACTYNPRFIVIGTHWGMVYLLDVFGNEIKRYSYHSACVNFVCSDGDYFASAGDDGKVVIYQLGNDQVQTFTYKRPIKAVALSTDYENTRQYAVGGMSGQLTMNVKGWLGSRDEIVHQGEGPIYNIKWHKHLLAWNNEKAVVIYDTYLSQIVGYVERPPESPRADLYRCQLFWMDEKRLLIGWANSVKLLQVEGCCVFNDYILLLSFPGELIRDDVEEARQVSPRPEIRILNEKYEEIGCDALSIHGFELCQPNDYKFGLGDDSVFILSPKDFVIGKKSDLNDRLRWMLERQRFDEAFELTKEKHDWEVSQSEVGQMLLDSLINKQHFVEASQKLPEILGSEKNLWEKWVYTFSKNDNLALLADKVPVSDPQLSATVYEMILAQLFVEDKPKFLSCLRRWPKQNFHLDVILELLKEELAKEAPEPSVVDAACWLYEAQGMFDMILECKMKIRDEKLLDFITDHQLYQELIPRLPELLSSNEDEMILDYVVKNHELIPIEKAVEALKTKPPLLFKYLDAIFRRDPRLNSQFHPILMELYADYSPDRILNFFRSSTNYSLERALGITKEKQLVREQVYLLGRMGNNKLALRIIISQLGDYKMAVDFAKEQNDQDLYEDLIRESFHIPQLVALLLQHASAQVDPLRLLEGVKDQPLGRFSDALLDIIHDYNLQLSLLEGCQRIFTNDSYSLLKQLVENKRRATVINQEGELKY